MMKIEKKYIASAINKEKNILFAYLYGSFLSSNQFNDVDIAVYLKKMSFGYIADLKIKIGKLLNISPDKVDITVLNGILDSSDAFSLLFLEQVVKKGDLFIVKRNAKLWSDFLERYSNKSRAAEMFLMEARA